MEKMIYALYLVERLVIADLDFTFKGGTCLSLLIRDLRRFSIDVDINTQVEKEHLEETLNKVVDETRFTRFKLDEERSFINEFPKAHYDIFYTSEYDGAENSILLDVIFDEILYPEMVNLPIESNLFVGEGKKVNVKVPTIDSITGDKLTACAPNTIGIKYNTGKELQIIKQVFDVGQLYSVINNLETVGESFEKIAEKQMTYQKVNFDNDSILQDIMDTAFLIGMQKLNREQAKNKYDELFRGVERFPAYLPIPRYSTYNVVEDSAKAALLAAKIKYSNFDALPSIEIKDFKPKDFPIVSNKYSPIYKMIKGMPNLSVFYWYHITNIISKEE